MHGTSLRALRRVADRLVSSGVRTWVAYPAIDDPPGPLIGCAAEAVVLPTDLIGVRSIVGVARFARVHHVKCLYLADRPTWHPVYALLRLFTPIERIVVHDHTSGRRSRPRGIKWWAKKIRRYLPGFSVDHVITVSDYVTKRQIQVDLMQPHRVTRIWNGIAPQAPRQASAASSGRWDKFQIHPDTDVILCYGRADQVKGVQYLLQAFDLLLDKLPEHRHPTLVYCGDGWYKSTLDKQHAQMRHSQRVRMPGYVRDVSNLSGFAVFCVFPSVWEEAFGLGALEPMARGVPVIASSVGGLPEVVADGESGLLVPPADVEALCLAMKNLLNDSQLRERLGRGARTRTREAFDLVRNLDEITAIVWPTGAISAHAR